MSRTWSGLSTTASVGGPASKRDQRPSSAGGASASRTATSPPDSTTVDVTGGAHSCSGVQSGWSRRQNQRPGATSTISAAIRAAFEERRQLRRHLVWALLGEEVAAVERPPAHVVRPAAPDVEHVEPVAELVLPRPQGQHRALDPPLASIALVGVVVVRRAGAVVLAHPVNRLGVVDACLVIGERLGVEAISPAAEVVGAGISADQALGQVERLREEVPVPVDETEFLVGVSPHLGSRDYVEHGQSRDALWMVERQPVGATAAAVVTGDGEAFEAELS